MYTCKLHWILDENGKIRRLKAIGGNEEFNILCMIALFKTDENWIPSIIKGKTIKSILNLPITI